MSAQTILMLVPIIVTLIEVAKRFIPDQHRTWANPVVAVIVGLAGAWQMGGTGALVDMALNALAAAAAAVAAYKVPKMVGQAIGTEEKK